MIPLSQDQFGVIPQTPQADRTDTYPTRGGLSTALGFSARREAARRVSRAPKVTANTFPKTLPSYLSN